MNDKTNMIDYILKRTEKKRFRSVNRQTCDTMISCPTCKQVWEWNNYDRANYKINEAQHYYIDFPHYGKPVEKCPKCKDRKKRNILTEQDSIMNANSPQE